MRILVHDYLAYPFVVELARELARRGNETVLLHGGGVRASRGATGRTDNDSPNLTIERVDLAESLKTRAGPSRLLQERRYGRALARQVSAANPDVVLSVPSSLDGQRAALRAAHRANAGFVFWLQDLYSQAIRQLIGRRSRVGARMLGARFARLERRLLQRSDGIVAISDDFSPILDGWRVDPERLTIIPNWAPLGEVTPMPKANAWAQVHGLDRVPVALYAGTLGRKHDPGLLLALADAVPDARVVVVAEGAGADRLRELGRGRTNLVVLPLQPIERLPEVLATADLLVAILDEDASIFSVPSKVLTYLTAGRPILAAIPSVNLAARTITESGAGRVVDPGATEAFIAAARAVLDAPGDDGDAGRAGREYAEREFAIGPIADRFESVLEAAMKVGSSRR
ncbi:MAG TPA: glycosyltransferase family 4 protein [Candidatus Limnocylindria bacterium]